jgi:hypothetical protein
MDKLYLVRSKPQFPLFVTMQESWHRTHNTPHVEDIDATPIVSVDLGRVNVRLNLLCAA